MPKFNIISQFLKDISFESPNVPELFFKQDNGQAKIEINIDINIKGVLNVMAAVLPEFIAQKYGHIIVTSSRAGTKSVPGNAVYCGTKHFVRAMLDSFRSESIMEGTNIRTTTIYPGAIKTELLNGVAESETKNMVSQFYENVGLTPDVIANAVLYAISQPDNVAVSDLVVCPSMEG